MDIRVFFPQNTNNMFYTIRALSKQNLHTEYTHKLNKNLVKIMNNIFDLGIPKTKNDFDKLVFNYNILCQKLSEKLEFMPCDKSKLNMSSLHDTILNFIKLEKLRMNNFSYLL